MSIEEAKQKRLEELQKQLLQQNEANTQEQLVAQQEQAKKTILQKYLTKEARERLNTLRVGHPALAEQVEMILVQAIQYGQLKETINDKQLKELLLEINKEKREFKIKK